MREKKFFYIDSTVTLLPPNFLPFKPNVMESIVLFTCPCVPHIVTMMGTKSPIG